MFNCASNCSSCFVAVPRVLILLFSSCLILLFSSSRIPFRFCCSSAVARRRGFESLRALILLFSSSRIHFGLLLFSSRATRGQIIMFFAVISAQGVLSPSIGKHRRADAVEVMATDNLPDLVDSLAFNPRGIPFHIMLLLRMASG